MNRSSNSVANKPEKPNGVGASIRIGAAVDDRAALAAAADRLLFQPGRPQRYAGPNVIVIDADGERHRECGLASAESVLTEYSNGLVTDGTGADTR